MTEEARDVILAEPWWTRADKLQAISRCYHQGQTKVYVYRIVSLNLVMALHVRRCANQRFGTTNAVVKKLVRANQEDPTVDIPLFTNDYVVEAPSHIVFTLKVDTINIDGES
ncbi:hypothetical protein LY76DRAFT_429248 [Colletotrichum caudatum]|nr:hypothetical protein LY76DRAFT_429248 [Colletotrichum caudatum]